MATEKVKPDLNKDLLEKKTLIGLTGAGISFSNLVRGDIEASSLRVASSVSRLRAKQAATSAKLNSLAMLKRFNDITSNQAVLFSSQGRTSSSGTVQNILREDQERLQWDIDFNRFGQASAEIGSTTTVDLLNQSSNIASSRGRQLGLLGIASTASKLGDLK